MFHVASPAVPSPSARPRALRDRPAHQQRHRADDQQRHEQQRRRQDARRLAPRRAVVLRTVHGVQGPAEHREIAARRPQGADHGAAHHHPRRGALMRHGHQRPAHGRPGVGRGEGGQVVDELLGGRGIGQPDQRHRDDQRGQQRQDRVVGQARRPVRHIVVPDGHRRTAQCGAALGPGGQARRRRVGLLGSVGPGGVSGHEGLPERGCAAAALRPAGSARSSAALPPTPAHGAPAGRGRAPGPPALPVPSEPAVSGPARGAHRSHPCPLRPLLRAGYRDRLISPRSRVACPALRAVGVRRWCRRYALAVGRQAATAIIPCAGAPLALTPPVPLGSRVSAPGRVVTARGTRAARCVRPTAAGGRGPAGPGGLPGRRPGSRGPRRGHRRPVPPVRLRAGGARARGRRRTPGTRRAVSRSTLPTPRRSSDARTPGINGPLVSSR